MSERNQDVQSGLIRSVSWRGLDRNLIWRVDRPSQLVRYMVIWVSCWSRDTEGFETGVDQFSEQGLLLQSVSFLEVLLRYIGRARLVWMLWRRGIVFLELHVRPNHHRVWLNELCSLVSNGHL